MRRSAVSIPSNIAEGQGGSSTGEFRLFPGHAKGSLFELETQTLIAKDLLLISAERADALLALITEVGRLIHGLLNSLEGRMAAAGTSH
ncbi:MAG: four helix bundle protein [Terriglobales bacterium]